MISASLVVLQRSCGCVRDEEQMQFPNGQEMLRTISLMLVSHENAKIYESAVCISFAETTSIHASGYEPDPLDFRIVASMRRSSHPENQPQVMDDNLELGYIVLLKFVGAFS